MTPQPMLLGKLLGRDRYIGPGHEPYVIAEVGGNHDGNLAKALLMIEQAALAGADCVKFQIFSTEELFATDTEKFPAVRGFENQFVRQKYCELPREYFKPLSDKCKELGIHFTASAWDKDAVDMLEELGAPFIKVGSGDVNAIPLLKYMASKNMKVIMSTAGTSKEQIQQAVDIIGKDNLVLLHCSLPYPTKFEDIGMRRMQELEKEFDVLVGYSDHSLSLDACIGACFMGASVLEKHYATNNGFLCTGDHKVSAEVEDLKELVKLARRAFYIMGDPGSLNELTHKDSAGFAHEKMLRAIVARKPIKAGEVLSEDNIWMRRPESRGVSAFEWDNVVGKTLKRDLDTDDYLQEGDY